MGTYTTNLRLYKPDADEFVDPDIHLNNNLNTIDTALKRLMEYEYTNLDVPDITDSVDRARFYKSYSNSVTAYFRSGNFFYQDPTAFVSTWTRITSFAPGFFEHPDYPVAWRIVRKASAPTTAEIEWTGAMWAEGNPMDLNNNVSGAFALPGLATPTVSKYFTMWSGNTSSNYSIVRMGFFSGSPGDFQYKRYGQDPAFGDEARIEFTGIKYNVEVAA